MGLRQMMLLQLQQENRCSMQQQHLLPVILVCLWAHWARCYGGAKVLWSLVTRVIIILMEKCWVQQLCSHGRICVSLLLEEVKPYYKASQVHASSYKLQEHLAIFFFFLVKFFSWFCYSTLISSTQQADSARKQLLQKGKQRTLVPNPCHLNALFAAQYFVSFLERRSSDLCDLLPMWLNIPRKELSTPYILHVISSVINLQLEFFRCRICGTGVDHGYHGTKWVWEIHIAWCSRWYKKTSFLTKLLWLLRKFKLFFIGSCAAHASTFVSLEGCPLLFKLHRKRTPFLVLIWQHV